MRVLLIDDHELFRAGMALLLGEVVAGVELLHASTLSQGLQQARTECLNVVFLDLDLPDGHGCDAISELKDIQPSLPVIVLSADARVETIRRCIDLGAMGYVPKSSPPEALRAAISAAIAGGVFLPKWSIERMRHDLDTHEPAAHSPDYDDPRTGQATDASSLGLTVREFETLVWIVRGLPSKSIAAKMGLEDITVRKYISNLLAHFNLRRRTELIVMLADKGIRLGLPAPSAPSREPALPCLASRRNG